MGICGINAFVDPTLPVEFFLTAWDRALRHHKSAWRVHRPKRDSGPMLSILIEAGDAAFDHGGFPIQRPIEPITAQMSLRCSVAVALLDGAALIKQFAH